MGPALQAAFLVMNHIGGKLLLFQAAAPSLGIGRIKARDNPALYGTDREYSLRTPDDPFYKRFSAEASRWGGVGWGGVGWVGGWVGAPESGLHHSMLLHAAPVSTNQQMLP